MKSFSLKKKKEERNMKPFLNLQVTYVGICGIRREGLVSRKYSHIIGAELMLPDFGVHLQESRGVLKPNVGLLI